MAQQVSWQEYKTVAVRASTVLTNAYVAGVVIGAATNDANQLKTNDQVDQWNKLALEVTFTLGSLTSADIKIEFSEDNTNFFQLTKSSFSGGTNTPAVGIYHFTANFTGYLDVNTDFFNGAGFKTKYIRVSSSGIGTVTNSLLAITAVVGVA
jgi:hypothetical protein